MHEGSYLQLPTPARLGGKQLPQALRRPGGPAPSCALQGIPQGSHASQAPVVVFVCKHTKLKKLKQLCVQRRLQLAALLALPKGSGARAPGDPCLVTKSIQADSLPGLELEHRAGQRQMFR